MSRPRLAKNINPVAGLAALALFGLFAVVFLGAEFGVPVGFDEGVSITASIGYALFDLVGESSVETEGFLLAFEIIDLVLVAALVGAIMLARREDEGSVRERLADGGRRKEDDE